MKVLNFTALGSPWSIETEGLIATDVKQAIENRLRDYDRVYSRFRDDSLAMRCEHVAGVVKFPSDFQRLYGLYDQLFDLTEGRMTPVIGKAIEQSGYDRHYSLRAGEIRSTPSIRDVIKWDGKVTVEVMQPLIFDFGAAGKGYAADIIGRLLEENGIDEYIVDASGDIRHRGRESETVGLEHPFDATKVVGSVRLENQSLCASSINRRAWGDMHHIIDPIQRSPARKVVATWVIAADALIADGLATALFFVDSPSELHEKFDFTYVRIKADGSVDYSPGFEGELYI